MACTMKKGLMGHMIAGDSDRNADTAHWRMRCREWVRASAMPREQKCIPISRGAELDINSNALGTASRSSTKTRTCSGTGIRADRKSPEDFTECSTREIGSGGPDWVTELVRPGFP